jgi:amino acid transporter
MSEAAHAPVPFSETKAPEAPERLHRGALSLVDISASTMANIGPAYSFFFSAGLIVMTAGVAAPLTIIAAGIAIALLGNTLSQFSRAQPSTGGFITFVGKTFGGTSAVTTALLCGAGYIIAISSVLAVSGGFLSIILQYYFKWNVPWGIFSVLLTAGAVYMVVRGVAVSTKLAGFFFGFEMLVLIVVSVAALIKHGAHLNFTPFETSHLVSFSGAAAGFPLAIYLFIGWENSAALAEETTNPRRNVPRAVFLSIALMGVSYLLFTYSTVVGFGYNAANLANSTKYPIPFITVAHNVVAGLAVIAYLAGMTSTLGVLISAINSQARLIFNAGREGLLPRWIGKVHPTRRTPVNAIYVFVAVAGAIIVVWALLHLIGGHSGSMNPINFFDESGTMGTILVLVVYFLSNLALPFYYRKFRPTEFHVVKHLILPVLGMLAIAVPVYYLAHPSPAVAPYDWFPWAALAIVVVAVIYSVILSRRDPGLGERAGSIVADE